MKFTSFFGGAAATALTLLAHNSWAQNPNYHGKFVAVLPPAQVQSANHKMIHDVMARGKVLDVLAAALNKTFVLPSNLTITMSESDDFNAYYSHDKHSLIINYGLMDWFIKQAQSSAGQPEIKQGVSSGGAVAEGVFTFVVFHELGHAFIDMLDIPMLGREEDAADQCATVVMLQHHGNQLNEEKQERMLVRAAFFFLKIGGGANQKIDLDTWGDEHAIGPQRFYNILAWLYGSSSTNYKILVDNKVIPEHRAELAPGEYKRMQKAWVAFLKPALRKGQSL